MVDQIVLKNDINNIVLELQRTIKVTDKNAFDTLTSSWKYDTSMLKIAGIWNKLWKLRTIIGETPFSEEQKALTSFCSYRNLLNRCTTFEEFKEKMNEFIDNVITSLQSKIDRTDIISEKEYAEQEAAWVFWNEFVAYKELLEWDFHMHASKFDVLFNNRSRNTSYKKFLQKKQPDSFEDGINFLKKIDDKYDRIINRWGHLWNWLEYIKNFAWLFEEAFKKRYPGLFVE